MCIRDSGSLADGVLRTLDVHTRQLGGLEEQRFHRHLQTRENRAALLRAVLVDGSKGGCRAYIHDDERLAVLANRRNRVDQSVRADLARVGIAVFNADKMCIRDRPSDLCTRPWRVRRRHAQKRV